MTLDEVRKQIDAIDPQIRELIMKRMDCSYEVAKAKTAAGETQIYRADREEQIIAKLSEGVPEDRAAGYVAVIKKIMEASRMYQYGLLFDWNENSFASISEGVEIVPGGSRVVVSLVRPNRPNAMSAILSMIGDYGYDMEKMELTGYSEDKTEVTFELTILGDLSEVHMQKLMYQLNGESKNFKILKNC